MIMKSNLEKGQVSFLIKSLMIVASIIAFMIVIYVFQSFWSGTIESKESSELRDGALGTLQKLITSKECLAYSYNGTVQKGHLDIEKIKSFMTNYSGVEPRCARSKKFDYKIEIEQLPKNFTLYPGMGRGTQKSVRMRYLCSDPANYGLGRSRTNNRNNLGQNEFILISCNYDPKSCKGVCDACGEFDIFGRSRSGTAGGTIVICPKRCGKNPLENCPYTGSCNTRRCPAGQPPGGVCCTYLRCPESACDYVVNAGALGHSTCWVGYGDCDLSMCEIMETSDLYVHGHCAEGTIRIPEPTGNLKNISVEKAVQKFGIGFGVSTFSPPGAKEEEINLVLPITIRLNRTTSRYGRIKITAVRGEMERIASFIEDICLKASKNPQEKITVSKEIYFSYPISYDGSKLRMKKSARKLDCKYPIEFEDITEKGDYAIQVNYSPRDGIKVKK